MAQLSKVGARPKRPDNSREYIGQQVVRICAEVLQKDVEELDQGASFISQGGDSILAIKVMAHCRKEYIAINVRDLFISNTITEACQLAQQLDLQDVEIPQTNAKPSSLSAPDELHTANSPDILLAEKLKPILQSGLHIQGRFSCSSTQERLLVRQSTDPNMYQCCYTLRFSSSNQQFPLSSRRLGAAWKQVVERHSILRTVLVNDPHLDGRFNQIVLDSVTPAIQYYEGSKYLSSSDFISNKVISYLPSEVPHHIQFIRTKPEEVHVKLQISHVIVDGQSAAIILQDLCKAYSGECISTPALSYAEYSSSSVPSHTQDPPDHATQPLPHEESTFLPVDREHESQSDLMTVSLDMPVSHEFQKKISSIPGVTLAAVCQLSWALVLQSLTASDDICFSYATSGRNAPVDGLQDAVGPFVESLLCRIGFQSKSKIRDALIEVAKDIHVMAEAPSITDLSDSGGKSKSVRQLTNTTLSFQRALDELKTSHWGLTADVTSKYAPTDYDVAIYIASRRDSLTIDLDFWESRIDRARANTILAMFQQAIESVLTLHDEPISEISLFSRKDADKLTEWNSRVPTAIRSCVHDKVAQTVRQWPGETAVCAWDGSLTYHELYTQSATLAYHLLDLGVGPEKMVGVCMSKSKWTIITMLAILAAGGVVVPFGVTHPVTRIQTLVEDTGAKILLVDEEQSSRLAQLREGTALKAVNADLLTSLPMKSELPLVGVRPENAAWVIFTSGSTGTPKGVILTHTNLVTSLLAHGSLFGVGSNTRTGQFAAFTFDVSISDIFMTLCFGGCVCVFSEADRMNNLTKALQTLHVNFVNLTPTVLGLLDPQYLPEIKTVAAGGEPLDASIIERWGQHTKLFNTYGPSECTIMSVCNGPVTDRSQAGNVGYPSGTRVWVTQANNPNRLCPIGIEGELLIEGPMVSRGYLNDAGKTAASFIQPALTKHLTALSDSESKYLQDPIRCMYRSGDIVRQNDDGTITHLGRKDTQVKIRGQRVEIGEIEHAILQQLKEARHAVVVVDSRGQQREQKNLIAVIELDQPNPSVRGGQTNGHGNPQADSISPLSPDDNLSEMLQRLKTSLFEILPPYMVPNMFVPVSKVPLNLSGKLDRRTIALQMSNIESETLQSYLPRKKTVTATSTNAQQKLQQLWAKALGVGINQVGADDHFFHIGGDSVAAMRVVAAGREMQLSMTVADIYRFPRLSEQAQILDRKDGSVSSPDNLDTSPFSLWHDSVKNSAESSEALLLEIAAQCNTDPARIEDIYPATPLQEGLLALSGRQSSAYTSVEVYSLSSNVDIVELKAAWQTAIQSTPILRTRIIMGQQCPLQVVVKDLPTWQEGISLEAYLNANRDAMMGPGQPLNRFAFIKTSSESRFFVWTKHHSTYDGWSRALVLQQVANAYLHKVLDPTTPFTRLISYLNRTDSDAAASYWREQLQGNVAAEFPPLPRANYQPHPQQRFRHQISLPAGRSREFLVSEVLRAAWAVVVSQYIGNDSPAFAVALSGRDAPVSGIMNLAGPTIATVPLRIVVDRTQTVQSFLQQVHQQAVEMIPYVHTGLRRIKQLVPDCVSALELRHLFLVQPARDEEQKLDIPGMEPVDIAQSEFDTYALNVECTLGSDYVAIDARFDENVIKRSHILRIMDQFAHVVQKLCEPTIMQQALGDVDLVNSRDLDRIRTWNQHCPDSVERCLHDLVADMVKAQPEAQAIIGWDGSFTYSQLLDLAARAAAYLNHLGVRAEVPVGVCMDKSVWTCVAFLAILKAGGVVVPLGVNHPVARVQSLLQQTEANLVLVNDVQSSRLADLEGKQISPGHATVSLITVESKLFKSIPAELSCSSTVFPSNAAWIIFTSGSTGIPKAAVLEHNSLCTSIFAHGARFGFTKETRTIQFASHTFDAVIQDYFTTLVHGGTVCVLSEKDRMDDLSGAMSSMGVNLINCTSTVARLLNPADLPNLKTMVLSGEPVQASALDLWYKHVDIINCYGIAECSIDSTSTYKKRLADPREAISIGFPLASRVWVTDPSNPNRLCPVGAPGELVVESPAVGRGYLNNREKTAASFITKPDFIDQVGLRRSCRMYRSGDLGLYNEDGSLEHLGRIDTQVKIRGQRVEIGEIEYWIAQKLPDAKQVAVVATNRGDGNQQLLLVIVEFAEHSLHRGSYAHGVTSLQTPAESLRRTLYQLQADLLEVLPVYMVPRHFAQTDRLPLNPSGKLDRRAVSDLVASSIDAEQLADSFVTSNNRQTISPSTATEKQIQELWAKALGTDRDSVSADDHFFQLGGDSVVAMRVVALDRAAEEHDRRLGLTVADVFENPKLSDLAAVLEERRATTAEPVMDGVSADDDEEDDAPFSMLEDVGIL